MAKGRHSVIMTMLRALPVLLTLFIVGPITAVSAETYYVAVDGSDRNPGTLEAPWASIHQANHRVKPGDVVKVKAGVYRQNIVIDDCRGTAQQPVVFEAAGGTVTIDGSCTISNWRAETGNCYSAEVGKKAIYQLWSGDRFLLGPRYLSYPSAFAKAVTPTKDTLQRGQCLLENGRLYVRLFDGGDPNQVTMRGSTSHSLLLKGVDYTVWRGIGTAWGLNGYKLEAGSAHNLVTDAELQRHEHGILEVGKADIVCHDNTFQRLNIHDIGLSKFEHGIYIGGLRTQVLNCRLHHISGAAIHAYPNPSHGRYEGNVISDPLPAYYPQHFTGKDLTEPTTYYTAIICWGPGEHQVTNNLVVGPFSLGISVHGNDNRLVNNTIVLRDGVGVLLVSERGNTLLNNIIQTAGLYVSGDTPTDLDYNGYWGGKGWTLGTANYLTLGEVRKVGLEAHGLVADPRFVDRTKGNLHLSPASPMRRVGTPLAAPPADLLGVARPQQSPVDLGAYEE